MSNNLNCNISINGIITISSTAMNLFIMKYNNAQQIPRGFIRNAYLGGRTEVFNLGLNMGNVYHFDVPGIYALCIQIPLPTGNPVRVIGFKDDLNVLADLKLKSFCS